jgi:hypothetical protein
MFLTCSEYNTSVGLVTDCGEHNITYVMIKMMVPKWMKMTLPSFLVGYHPDYDYSKIIDDSTELEDAELARVIFYLLRNDKTQLALDIIDRADPNIVHMIAAEYDMSDLFLLLAQYYDIDESLLEDLLVVAAEFGSINVVKYLITIRWVNPAIRNNLPLRMAVTWRHYNIVDLLLDDNRVDPSAAHNDALLIAIKNDDLLMVTILLGHPKVVDSVDLDVAKIAIDEGNYKILRQILEETQITHNDNLTMLREYAQEVEDYRIMNVLNRVY